MSLVPIELPPGLYTEDSDRAARGRWKAGNRVRFYKGKPESIGGWSKATSAAWLGQCRGLRDFQALSGLQYVGIGTHLKLYIAAGDALSDITPIRASSTIDADPFATTDASADVVVTDTAHGALLGDFVTFAGATAVGGITIDGEYQIQAVADANTYTITHSAAATSTASGGGAAVTAAYQIAVGGESGTLGLGWGVGPWGGSTWGTARSSSNIYLSPRTWSLDLWGEDLLANPRGGGVYVWDTSGGTSARATLITNAPATAQAIVVSPTSRHLLALGAYDGSNNDPLLIRWCAQEDYTTWTPSDTNDAGERRIDGGNAILAGVRTNKEILVLTDETAHVVRFVGPPHTFGAQPLGKAGLRGPKGVVEEAGVAYWFGNEDFLMYAGGRPQPIPCDVRKSVFDDLNETQRDKCHAGVNRTFNEIWWFYCSASSQEIDRAVAYNHVERHWSLHELERTAWLDKSEVFRSPYAAGPDGYLYGHESGITADGAAVDAYVESGDMELGEGAQIMRLSGFIPDFKRLTGAVDISVKARLYPAGAQIVKGPKEITSAKKFVKLRARGRQMAVRLAETGGWRMPRRADPPKLEPDRRGSATYVIYFREDGRSREHSTGETDRGAAEAYFARWLARRGQASGPLTPDQMRVAEVLDIYGERHAPTTRAPATIGYAIDALLPYWGHLPVSAINSKLCRAYAERRRGEILARRARLAEEARRRAQAKKRRYVARPPREASDGTARRELGVLEAAIAFCVEQGDLTHGQPVELPQRPPARQRWLTRAEAAAWMSGRSTAARPQAAEREQRGAKQGHGAGLAHGLLRIRKQGKAQRDVRDDMIEGDVVDDDDARGIVQGKHDGAEGGFRDQADEVRPWGGALERDLEGLPIGENQAEHARRCAAAEAGDADRQSRGRGRQGDDELLRPGRIRHRKRAVEAVCAMPVPRSRQIEEAVRAPGGKFRLAHGQGLPGGRQGAPTVVRLVEGDGGEAEVGRRRGEVRLAIVERGRGAGFQREHGDRER